MASIFSRDLGTLTYEELVAELDAISDETDRLEIKQELSDRNRIANTACALANTFGGLIVIGFLDPERSGGKIVASGKMVDTSVRAANALLSSVQAKSHPSVRCESYGLNSSDGKNGALILRVHESTVGPHEYIGGGEHRNLVVRRQRENAAMPLSHLEGMQRRAAGYVRTSPLSPIDSYPLVQIRPFNAPEGEFFFGALVVPEEYPLNRHILRRSDDESLCAIVRQRCSRLNRLAEQTLVDGILLKAEDFESNSDKTKQEVHIRVDGELTLKMGHDPKQDAYWSEIVFLGNVYVLGSRVFNYLQIAPRARVSLAFRCAPTNPPLPDLYEDFLFVDFSKTDVHEFIRDAMLLAGRAAKSPMNDESVVKSISAIWRQEFTGMNEPDLRVIWD